MQTQTSPYLPVFNTIGFVLVLVMNYLATSLPLAGRDTGEISDLYPNLFAPAGFTFAIWGIIYLLLLLFIIYQIRYTGKKEQPVFFEKIGWLFFISCLANATWLLAWHHLKIGLALIIMLIILGSLLSIYLRLNIGKSETTKIEKWLVHFPFSVYLGWITVATIANTTIFLVSLGWNGQPLNAVFWTIATIAAAVGINLWALFSRKDFAFALVGIWALWGIFQKRMSDLSMNDGSVEIVTLIGIALIAIGILYTLIKRK
ncbi:MAG: hypothetical protein R2825_20195 [Saprospiraceae bacterium]